MCLARTCSVATITPGNRERLPSGDRLPLPAAGGLYGNDFRFLPLVRSQSQSGELQHPPQHHIAGSVERGTCVVSAILRTGPSISVPITERGARSDFLHPSGCRTRDGTPRAVRCFEPISTG
jgi:hypothetical protein